MLASSLQASTSCNSVSLEYRDDSMLDYSPEGDKDDPSTICYGAVSMKLIVQRFVGVFTTPKI